MTTIDYAALHQPISNDQRLRLVKDYPLTEVFSAPGHRHLRNPAAVEAMARAMTEGDLAQFLNEPILIGLFTDVAGRKVSLRSVECLDGHHRLLAGLRAGVWRTLADIPVQAVDTRVNGWRHDGTEAEVRWIPLDVARRSQLPDSAWSEVPPEWGAKGPTAMISGDIASIDDVFSPSDRGVQLGVLLKEL